MSAESEDPTHLEVLVEEVEDEQDGHQRWQSKRSDNPDEDNSGGQLQKGTQEEGSEICQVFVSIHSVLGQPIDDAAQRRCVEKSHWRSAICTATRYQHCSKT